MFSSRLDVREAGGVSDLIWFDVPQLRRPLLLVAFEGVFDAADVLIVTDIYSAGEKPREGINGGLIVEAIRRRAGHPTIVYHADRASLPTRVMTELRPGDLCLTLGAGDLVSLPDEVQPLLEPTQERQ